MCPDESVSIGLDTSGYEVPLSRLTTVMNTFNTASVVATAQQKQMAKVMTDLGNIYSSYAKILVQTSKATAIAVEGPSEALNKRFQNAQRVLANMDRELQKLQASGERVANLSLTPKDLTRTGKAIGDAFERVFKNIEQRAAGVREKIALELQKGVTPGTTTRSDIAAATAEKDVVFAEYTAKLNAMKINADYEKSLAEVTARREKESQAIIAAANAELAAEVERYNKQVALMAKNEAASAKYWAKQEKDAEKALEAMAEAVMAEAVAEFKAAENAMEINGQRIKIIEKMADTEEKVAAKIQSAADKEVAAEIAKYNKQVEGLAKTEAASNEYFRVLTREKQLIDTLRATYGQQIAAMPTVQQADLNEKVEKFAKDIAASETVLTGFEKKLQAVSTDEKATIDTTDSLTRQIVKFDDTLTKAGAKVGFADEIKKGIVSLEQAFKGVTGIDVTKLNPRQQQIMRDAFEAAAKSANKVGLSIQDLTKVWEQYRQGTLKVDDNNREVVNILNEVSAAHERATLAVDKHTRAWQRFGQLVFARALTAAFYNFTNMVRSNIQTTLDLSKAIGEIQTVSHDVPLIYDRWAMAVQELSDQYNMLQSDIAEGLYQAISNQIGQGQQAITFMHTAGQFARATVSSMEDSINLLSSALNAFQMPATAANRVAAELFKTIELGRVRATDMADTLGRSAVLTHQAGISFEEYLSMIQQFTISGVRFSQASTFIINVINKLMKPSVELKNLFKEWGVSSGQAAIQMFGLSGVVRKLLEETGGDLGELSEYIKDIRGTTGFAGLMSNIDSVEANIKETLRSTADYFQAIQETTTTTGYILTAEANKIRNVFMEHMMMFEKMLASANKVLNMFGTSAGEIGGGALPALTVGLLGSTLLRLLVQASTFQSAIPALVFRIGLWITGLSTLTTLLYTWNKNTSAIKKVVEQSEKDAEYSAVLLSKINEQLVADIQKINAEKIQEIVRAQELEKAVVEKGLIAARDAAKERLQIEQQAREAQRDELKKRITDLEQANRDAEKYIDDLTRKYQEQRIEERKASPFVTPFERFDITMLGAQQLFSQAMQQLVMAGTKEELQQASALFDSYMKQMADARKIAQSELGNLEPVEIDRERDARFRQFVDAYRGRQKEIVETELPQLRNQLNALNREVRSYAEASKEVNTQLEKNIENEKHLVELLKIKVGLRATELLMAGETGEAIRAAVAYNKQMGDLEQQQVKERQKATENVLQAQQVLFEAFTLPETFEKMIGQMHGLAAMVTGESPNAPIVLQVNQLEGQIAGLTQKYLSTGTSREARMELLQTTSPALIKQAIGLGQAFEQQIASGALAGNETAKEMLTTLKEILDAYKEQQGYIESGRYALAIASANDRKAMQEGSGVQQATQRGTINALKLQTELEQQGYPGFPVPGGTKGGLVMHQGGWVPHLARGGNVPAYLQAGEYVVDRETAASWDEWQKWLTGFAGGQQDPVAAYEMLQLEYQHLSERNNRIRAAWIETQKSGSLSGISPSERKAQRQKMQADLASSTVIGPTGPLDINTLGAAINALNSVPEMQKLYWDNYTQQLKDKYGTSQEALNPELTYLQDTLERQQRQYIDFQKDYNRAINKDKSVLTHSDYRSKLAEYQAKITSINERIGEVQWLYNQVPRINEPSDLDKSMPFGRNFVRDTDELGLMTREEIIQHRWEEGFYNKVKSMAKVQAPEVVDPYVSGWWKEIATVNHWLDPLQRNTWQQKYERKADVLLNVGGMTTGIAGATLLAILGLMTGTTQTAAATLGVGEVAPLVTGGTGAIQSTAALPIVGAGVKGVEEVIEQAVKNPRVLSKIYTLAKSHPRLASGISTGVTFATIEAILKWLSSDVAEIPNALLSNPAQYKARGGFPGAPRGTDTIPAWLTPGEFVVNANAATRYRGLLEQLNSFGSSTRPNFISPQYHQGGGTVGGTRIYYNNNVTINHSTGNPALDATRIVQEINRQQSRGTAKVRTR